MAEAPDLSAIPVYQEFFHNHESYERFHIHVVGLTSTSGSNSDALKTRMGIFGTPRVIDAVADPYLIVKTMGEDTGSTDYFPIGEHRFPVLRNCQTPIWDAKCVLMAKKRSTTGIQFTFLDENTTRKDTVLFELKLGREELPDITLLSESKWTLFSKMWTDVGVIFNFYIMVTDGADRIVNPEDSRMIYQGMANGYEYSEQVLEDDTACEQDNSLLQCWRHDNSQKAVFWVLGRNDCFMHPHVAKTLFLEQGYDIYVLNYKMNGQCRQKGWFQDAHYNSHVPSGKFDVYIKDISSSLEFIGEHKTYDTVLGYAHSTGGPVLLNYLMEKGDGAFDAFVFNSPFLDWGFVGGDMVEFVLKHTALLKKISGYKNDQKLDAAVTPTAFASTPIRYLGQDIVMGDWSARLWSLYHFDFGSRPLYKVPMTIGFARGVTRVHDKMRDEFAKKKRAITSKPFLCITSRGDDVLKAPETLSRADWIGPGRWEIELNDNGHDVFLSYDQADTDMAIDMVLTWMKNRRLV